MCDMSWPKSMDSGWGRKEYWSGGMASATAMESLVSAPKWVAYSAAGVEGAGALCPTWASAAARTMAVIRESVRDDMSCLRWGWTEGRSEGLAGMQETGWWLQRGTCSAKKSFQPQRSQRCCCRGAGAEMGVADSRFPSTSLRAGSPGSLRLRRNDKTGKGVGVMGGCVARCC